MTAVAITAAHNEYRLSGSLAYLNVGSSGAVIEFYTSPQPATGAAPGAATYLGAVPLDDPPGVVDANVLSLAILSDGTAVASGTVAWARVKNRAGSVWADSPVSVTGGGAAVQMDDLDVVAGGSLQVTSADFV